MTPVMQNLPAIVFTDPYVGLGDGRGTRVYLEDFLEFQILRVERDGSEPLRLEWPALNNAYRALMANNGRPVS